MLQSVQSSAARMDKAKMMRKALLLANVKMAGECKERGKKQVKGNV